MRAYAASALLVLVAAASAAQQRHDTKANITFGADHFEAADKANRAIGTGNVVIKQGEMTLTSQRVTILYTGQVIGGNPQISRLDASGNVVVTRPDQTARANYGIYDLDNRTITMLGAVTLTQGVNTVSGGRMVLNLDTGRAVMDGSSVGGGGAAGGTVKSSGGRVTGTFSVPDRK